MPRWNQPRSAGGWLTVVLGVLLLLIGVVLTIGGVQLAALGGSWYYLIAGLALVVSGVLIVLRDVRGAWLYAATFAGTLIWAFWEKGLDGWALVPRLVGPLVLMFLVLATLPVLRSRGGGKTAGFGAEIAARLAEQSMYDLLAPVERVTGYDTHIPLFRLEMKYLPSVDKILAAARRAMAHS